MKKILISVLILISFIFVSCNSGEEIKENTEKETQEVSAEAIETVDQQDEAIEEATPEPKEEKKDYPTEF